jgi:hypothetical protein
MKKQREDGFDKSLDLEMKDYPLDSLLIREDPRSVFEVCRRIDDGTYIMDPDFQRDFVWPLDKQSRLIESLLMRIPLPVFYLAERNDGKIVVIDGLQRLTTVSRYLKNEFALRLTDGNTQLAGKRFKELPPKLQNRLEDSKLVIYILDEKVPERARLDIFERVNGGTPLSRQQMRNCLYCGPATRLLKRLAEGHPFIEATSNGLNKKTMRNREVINRYFAFMLLGIQKYTGDMDEYLASALQLINTMDDAQIKILEDNFNTAMLNCYSVWREQTFRKYKEGQLFRSVINAALFDVLSILVGNYKKEFTAAIKKRLQQKLTELLNNENFNNAITSSTNSLRQVKIRFEMAEDAFGTVLS